ncbi:MAG: hypothetical protein HWE25_04175 [Alphaproteobacteria bacterium]|nr:hypothetical protein [Alphaproteobacteria bacterium]
MVEYSVRANIWGEFPPIVRLFHWHESRKKAVHVGTAFLTSTTNGNCFLVTAKHCILPCADKNVFATFEKQKTGKLVTVDLKNMPFKLHPHLDVCASFLLPDPGFFDGYADMLDGQRILAAEPAAQTPLFGHEIFQIAGFIASKNKLRRSTDNDLHGHQISLGPARRHNTDHCADHWHRDLDLKKMFDDDGQSIARNFIRSPDGMSGGPLVRYQSHNGQIQGKLAGIFTRWDKRQKLASGIHWAPIARWLNQFQIEMDQLRMKVLQEMHRQPTA